MAEAALYRRAVELADTATPFVVTTVVGVTGSAPSGTGAKMLVTKLGLDSGTVGGGRVEAKAIEHAISMLAGERVPELVDWSLKADVGMTCGGRVKLYFEAVETVSWPIVIFGAGHVSQALTRLLVTLPCQVTCVDPRADWLGKLPVGIRAVLADNPSSEVVRLPENAFVLCMTQGHKSDLPVLREVFTNGSDYPYVGVIGSRAKAAVLRRELIEVGVSSDRIDFHCPMGLPIGSNSPSEIAVSIAAQLLQYREASSS